MNFCKFGFCVENKITGIQLQYLSSDSVIAGELSDGARCQGSFNVSPK
jgi:hypothetical protein